MRSHITVSDYHAKKLVVFPGGPARDGRLKSADGVLPGCKRELLSSDGYPIDGGTNIHTAGYPGHSAGGSDQQYDGRTFLAGPGSGGQAVQDWTLGQPKSLARDRRRGGRCAAEPAGAGIETGDVCIAQAGSTRLRHAA